MKYWQRTTHKNVLFGPAEDFGTDTLPGAIKAQHFRRLRKRPIHVGCADSNSAAAGGDTCQIVQRQERIIRGNQRPRARQTKESRARPSHNDDAGKGTLSTNCMEEKNREKLVFTENIVSRNLATLEKMNLFTPSTNDVLQLVQARMLLKSTLAQQRKRCEHLGERHKQESCEI